MASNELIRAFESYKSYYNAHGTDEKLISACIEAAKTAFKVEEDEKYGLQITQETKKYINQLVKEKTGAGFFDLERYAMEHDLEYNIINSGYDVYRLESYAKFESYMLYMERNRWQHKRFYLPRRNTLRVVADDMQRLENGELDVYGLSMPPRVGKSTIAVFFLSWAGLRNPDNHNAMGGHSGQLAKRFFRGLDNLIEQPEYRFTELFKLWHPEFLNVIQAKSSDPAEFTINLGTPDEFATYTCRGIDGTWTGAIDVSPGGYLYVDDLVRDREHSLSPSRMENTYQEYLNKMVDRCNEGHRRILVGTLWSVLDPLERERLANEGNPRALFRKIPALNENDESNFQYKVKGFSTQYYIDMRNRLEPPEWMAKYQQSPFVREGLTFPIEELRFFDGTVPLEKHRIIGHIDVAFGGGDRLSMPICMDYGEDKYIVGWVHDSRTPGFTVPKVADAINRFYITHLYIEKNSGGQLYADQLQKELDSRGITHCKIELYSARASISKEDKISGHSDYVRRHFLFLMPKRQGMVLDEERDIYMADADYRVALDEMTTWSAEGKGKQHDDSADSIASMAMLMDVTMAKKVKIMHSPI